jgi:glycosyltransferase involved in cell wall biosynthesis
MEELRIGIVTSSILVKTGFSTNIRCLLPWLYLNHPEWKFFHLNQCIGDEDPNLQRFPWHNEGVFKRGTFDENRFNNPADEGYRRFVSYGNTAIESFVLNNKLDILIHIEDIWSSDDNAYLNSKWYPFLKENVLQWSTADSLPILPNFKTWAEKCPNLWFWSGFAERALKKENAKYNHVSTQYGAVDVSEYFPLSKKERNEIRKQNNIDEDALIFIQLGRNQLRKLYPCTLESFSIFKKENPEIKAKLLFHCFWGEPGGWPLERLMTEFGIPKEDVLTTYFCRRCGKWEIKPFEGEDKPCRFCGSPNEQMTAGINSTISNRDLSKIYAVADASVSVFTSGGQEFHSVQSLLCGLPLLCSDYSCGEDFVAQPFVFRLDGGHTYEIQTGFQKHVPNLRTMVKFYKKISDLRKNPFEYEKISTAGREWALKNFSVEVVGARLEKWIKSRQRITWDYKYVEEPPKNPGADIPNIQDHKEWMKYLYKHILSMDVTDDDSGLNSWLNNIAQGQKREDILNYFRETAFKENQKNQKPRDFGELLDNTGRKRLLVVAKESIGDLLYTKGIIKSIKESYPDHDIYLATEPQYFELFNGDENIHKLITYAPVLENEIAMTGSGENAGYFQIFIMPTIATQKHLNYLTNNKIGLQLK